MARSDAQGAQPEVERVEAVAHPHAVHGADVVRERVLEGSKSFAQDERWAPHNRSVGVVELRLQLEVGGSDVEERNPRHASFGSATSERNVSQSWIRVAGS